MFGSSSSKKMEEQLFNLKFTAKQLARESKKCEKEEKAERLKVKKAIEKGNHEGAKIYAQNAIRQKNQAMNMLRLSSRVDAVASRLESAIRIGSISQAMTKVVSMMGSAEKGLDLEKLSKTMDSFEKSFENLDVASSVMEDSLGSSSFMTTSEAEVNELIAQVADEHHLELKGELRDAPKGKPRVAQEEEEEQKGKEAQGNKEEDDLLARLSALKAKPA